jgi:hypothetical protein
MLARPVVVDVSRRGRMCSRCQHSGSAHRVTADGYSCVRWLATDDLEDEYEPLDVEPDEPEKEAE